MTPPKNERGRETTGMDRKRALPPTKRIERSIYLIRGQKVMLDYELADLYGVPTKALKQAVKRNLHRFPSDFMGELTKGEFADLRSQIVTSSSPQWGGPRYAPMAFTEQGVAIYPVRDLERCAIHIHQGAKRTIDSTLDPQVLSISNGVKKP